MTNRERAQALIRAALESAVELALIRSDLRREDGIEIEDIEGISIDAAKAAFGIGTCSEEPVAEVRELLAHCDRVAAEARLEEAEWWVDWAGKYYGFPGQGGKLRDERLADLRRLAGKDEAQATNR